MSLSGPRGSFRMRVTGHYIEIERPLWCVHDLFFCYTSGHWTITDDYAHLMDMDPGRAADPHFIAGYLASSETITDRTPFVGIWMIMPGTVVRLADNGAYTVCPADVPVTPIDERDMPESVMEQIARAAQDRHVVIELSGGLDSSGIFYSALAVIRERERLRCVTYYDPNIALSSDVMAARSLCLKHGVDLTLVPLGGKGLVAALHAEPSFLPARPSPWLLQCTAQRGFLDAVAGSLPRSCILNGHGGDHIFLSDPQIHAVMDHLFRSPPDVAAAFRTAATLAVLQRRSWAWLTWHCATGGWQRSWQAIRDTPVAARWSDQEGRILTRECRRMICAERQRVNRLICSEAPWRVVPRQRRIMMEAVHHGTADRLTDSQCETVYPYLNPTLVTWGEGRRDCTTFSARHNRLQQRRSFGRRFDDPVFQRQGKGHISGMMQREISAEKDLIEGLVAAGEAAGAGFVRHCGVAEDLERCQLGGAMVSPAVLLLISLELYYLCWRQRR